MSHNRSRHSRDKQETREVSHYLYIICVIYIYKLISLFEALHLPLASSGTAAEVTLPKGSKSSLSAASSMVSSKFLSHLPPVFWT